MIFVLFSFQIDRLRILLSAHESIEDTVLWEQKIFIGATPLVNQPDELDVENVLSRKGSARESCITGIQLSPKHQIIKLFFQVKYLKLIYFAKYFRS